MSGGREGSDMRRRVCIVLEPAEHNWGAYSPDVPGCVSTGRTAQEALTNFEEALRLHTEIDGQRLLPEANARA